MFKRTVHTIVWRRDTNDQDGIVIFSMSDHRVLSYTRYPPRSVEDRIDGGWCEPSARSDDVSKAQTGFANESCYLLQRKAARPTNSIEGSCSRTPEKGIRKI